MLEPRHIGKEVRVHLHYNKEGWVVRVYESMKRDISCLKLENVSFHVDEMERQRGNKFGEEHFKTLSGWMQGTLVSYDTAESSESIEEFEEVDYYPRQRSTFQIVSTREPIFQAACIYCHTDSKAYIVNR
jgi:hypothetical protein